MEDNHNYVADGILVSNSGANSYLKINKWCENAFYRYGLTGSYTRTDGTDMVMHGVLSNVIYKITASELIKQGWLVRPHITMIEVVLKGWSSKPYKLAYKDITEYEETNIAIRDIAITKGLEERKQVLILVKQVDHGKYLESIIPNSVFLEGSMKAEERESYQDKFNDREIPVVIATAVFGEGIDIPNIDVLINARFQMSEIQTTQGIGRALRTTDGKNVFSDGYSGKMSCEVYDFMVRKNKHLEKHSSERLKVYKKEKEFFIKLIPMTELRSSL